MIKIKNKKANLFWEVIVGAIVIIIIGGAVLILVTGGLSAHKKNIDFLSSCKVVGGTCEEGCGAGFNEFSEYGCPDNKNIPNKKICCIPKEKPNEQIIAKKEK